MARQLKHDRRKRKVKTEEKPQAEGGSGRCPECRSASVGSSEREVVNTMPWPLNLIVGSLSPRSEAYMRCQYCGHTWMAMASA